MRSNHCVTLGLCCALALIACSKEKPTENVATAASAAEAAQPAAAHGAPFAVDSASSKVEFLMEAPIEKIHGEAPQSVQGELFFDVTDVTKSSGVVKVDLEKLVLYQQKRGDEKEQYGEKKKSDKQNEHMHDWLEISADSKNREQNRFAQFKVDKVENANVTDVTKLTGPARPVVVTASGDLTVHGKKNRKSTKLELTFNYAGDKLESVTVKTLEPLRVDLNEFDVRPRDPVGSILAKGLETLSPKVAKEAPILLEFKATPSGAR